MRRKIIYLVVGGILTLSPYAVMAELTQGFEAIEEKAYEKAYTFFLEQSKEDPEALFILSLMHEEGIETPQNKFQAINLLIQAVNAGNANALYNLGHDSRHKNIPSTFSFLPFNELYPLFKAAELGNMDAIILLGIHQLEMPDELIPKKDQLQKIKAYLEKGANASANGKELLATFLLALYWIQADRFGIEAADYQKSVSLLEDIYNKGFIFAAPALSYLYSEGGSGLEKNTELAEKYEQVVMQDEEAFEDMEALLTPKKLSLANVMSPIVVERRIAQLELLAKDGSASALSELAKRYRTGSGVPLDLIKARAYQKRFYELDNGESLYLLAMSQVKSDPLKAREGMIKAADKGYLPAMKWLTDYRNYNWNPDEALIQKYELKAAELQDVDSILRVIDRKFATLTSVDDQVLGAEIVLLAEVLKEIAGEDARTYALWSEIYRNGIGVESDLGEAFQLMNQAVSLDTKDPVNLMVLANMYLNGEGVEIDYQLSAQYYWQALLILRKIYGLEGLSPTRYRQTAEALLLLYDLTEGFKAEPDVQAMILGEDINVIKEESNASLKSTQVLNQLLDELALSLKRGASGGSGAYGYLLADRDFQEYQKSKSQILDKSELSRQKEQILYAYNSSHDRVRLHHIRTLLSMIKDDAETLNRAGNELSEYEKRVADIISEMTILKSPNPKAKVLDSEDQFEFIANDQKIWIDVKQYRDFALSPAEIDEVMIIAEALMEDSIVLQKIWGENFIAGNPLVIPIFQD